MKKTLKIILGPTAVGKTDYSIEMARKYDSPIISCDSRQIYKEMTIGTAVPTKEQLEAVQHYFIHSHSVENLYTAGDYEKEALALINKLFEEGHDTLVMSGGTGFYIDAVCKGLDDIPQTDPEVRKKLMSRLEEEGLDKLVEELRSVDYETFDSIDLQNSRRVVRALEVYQSTGKTLSSFKKGSRKKREFAIEKIGINRPREILYDRINKRVVQMIEEGLVDEVKTLQKYRELSALQTVGYREVFGYLDGNYPLEEAIRLIQRNTRHYAKRQLTWWRRDDEITWKEF